MSFITGLTRMLAVSLFKSNYNKLMPEKEGEREREGKSNSVKYKKNKTFLWENRLEVV